MIGPRQQTSGINAMIDHGAVLLLRPNPLQAGVVYACVKRLAGKGDDLEIAVRFAFCQLRHA
jgi:hypothetical protein